MTDLERSLAFWRGAVGLEELETGTDAAVLGSAGKALLVLRQNATMPAQKHHSGLYHLALHVPSEQAFADTIARIGEARQPQSPTDHVMHWATYAWDPDGIGLEVSFETLDRFDRYVGLDQRMPMVATTDGGRLPAVGTLDLDDVMSNASEQTPARIAGGTIVGHMHFHVGDAGTALDHYRDELGFEVATDLRDVFGMVDFKAGGSYPHRLAINEWQGHGAAPQPDGAARVAKAELTTASGDTGTLVTDPSGNTIELR